MVQPATRQPSAVKTGKIRIWSSVITRHGLTLAYASSIRSFSPCAIFRLLVDPCKSGRGSILLFNILVGGHPDDRRGTVEDH